MAKYLNESLKKGLSVLATVAASETPIGVTETAERSGIDYSTTYRLVMTLSDLGYIERDGDTKRYRASVGTLRLGYSYLRNNALHRASIPIMRELLATTGETVNLGARNDTEMVLLASCESDHLLGSRHTPSGRYPIHCTASGKVMLAGMKDDELHELLGRLELSRVTARTLRSKDALLREIDMVRRQGWALNSEEHVLGLVAVAAPIFDQTGQTIAALDVSAPTVRITAASPLPSLVRPLLDCATRISTTLGWTRRGDTRDGHDARAQESDKALRRLARAQRR